jgi:hypothetical protein
MSSNGALKQQRMFAQILGPKRDCLHAFPPNDWTAKTRVLKVNPGNGEKPLKVPLWCCDSAE